MTAVHVDTPAEGLLRLRLDGPDSLNAPTDTAKDELIAALEQAACWRPSSRGPSASSTRSSFKRSGGLFA